MESLDPWYRYDFFEEVETHRVPSADDPGLMSSEIDYNVYLDFTLAIEYMQSPEALRYYNPLPYSTLLKI